MSGTAGAAFALPRVTHCVLLSGGLDSTTLASWVLRAASG